MVSDSHTSARTEISSPRASPRLASIETLTEYTNLVSKVEASSMPLSTPAEIMGRKSVHFYVDPTGLVPVALRRAPRLPRWSRKSRQKIGLIARLIDRLNCLSLESIMFPPSLREMAVYKIDDLSWPLLEKIDWEKVFRGRKKLDVKSKSSHRLLQVFREKFTKKTQKIKLSVPSVVQFIQLPKSHTRSINVQTLKKKSINKHW